MNTPAIIPPPAPRKGYTMYYDANTKTWIWVKKDEPVVKNQGITKRKSHYNIDAEEENPWNC